MIVIQILVSSFMKFVFILLAAQRLFKFMIITGTQLKLKIKVMLLCLGNAAWINILIYYKSQPAILMNVLNRGEYYFIY